MPNSRALVAAIAIAAALLPACTGTCPKDKIEAGAAFVEQLCALEPLSHAVVRLRPGAEWATIDLPATVLSEGIPLALYADGAEFDNRPFALPAAADALLTALTEDAEKAEMLAENTGTPWSRRLILAVAADTPVEALAASLDLARRAGFKEATLIAAAAAGPAIPPLPVPEVRAEIDALAATLPDQTFAFHAAVHQLAEAEAARCPALALATTTASTVPHEQRCTALGREIIAACDACRCSADVSRALSLALIQMRPDTLHVERAVSLAADATPITAQPGERWRDLAPRLFAAKAPTVRLQLAP